MKSGDPLISIVVPVYNVGPYLAACVESLRQQTYRNIEIILIDDGSTDGSGAMCIEYAKRDSRIKTLRQDNRGLSGARNSGISLAEGRYVAFVDSDDYVSPLFVDALYKQIASTGCRMATMRHGVSFFDGKEPDLEKKIDNVRSAKVLTEIEYQKELLYQKSWNGSVWRLCDKSLLNADFFPEGVLFEDLATTYKLTKKCESVVVLDTCELYAYRQRSTSIMRGLYSHKKTESCLRVTRELFEDILDWYPELENAVSSRCFAVNRVVFSQIPLSMKEERRIIWHEIIKYRKIVLCDREARKRERIAAAFSMMGKAFFTLFCKSYRKILNSQ